MTTSLGFRTPSDEAVLIADAQFLVGGEPLENLQQDGWNDSLDVSAKFVIEVDLPRITRECGFVPSDRAVFGGTIGWKATGTGLHGSSTITELRDGSNELRFCIPGDLLGSELLIRPAVVLAETIANPSSSVVAFRRGSRLWETSFRLTLEGSGSQFPTSVLDFNSAGFEPANALWRVQIDPTLDSHISGSVRLFLNKAHPRTAAFLKNPRDAKQQDFSRFLKADVINHLITVAFNSDVEELKIAAQEPGTLAEALIEIHSTYFPTKSLEETKDQYKLDPGIVSSKVMGSIFTASEVDSKRGTR